MKGRALTGLSEILRDPAWLPHRFDARSNQVQFVHLTRAQIRDYTFLADLQPSHDKASWHPVAAINQAEIAPGRSHYIFHTAFVRSTLLTRALNFPSKSIGLSEPQILNDLALAGVAGQRALPLVLSLLSRPFADGEAVVIKASNTANELIPAILAAQPAARAILLTGSVESFLLSVHKKGMFGRRWARRLYMHVAKHVPFDVGLSESERFEATDLQFAGLAWLLQRWQFATLLTSQPHDRVSSLDSVKFNQSRGETLHALSRFFNLNLATEQVIEMVGGPVFTTHAKKGGDVDARLEKEAQAADMPVVEDEIRMVAEWITQIRLQAGLPHQLANPLL